MCWTQVTLTEPLRRESPGRCYGAHIRGGKTPALPTMTSEPGQALLGYYTPARSFGDLLLGDMQRQGCVSAAENEFAHPVRGSWPIGRCQIRFTWRHSSDRACRHRHPLTRQEAEMPSPVVKPQPKATALCSGSGATAVECGLMVASHCFRHHRRGLLFGTPLSILFNTVATSV